jgi:hypothetical protein
VIIGARIKHMTNPEARQRDLKPEYIISDT